LTDSAAAAFFAAHRFLSAATIAAFPAALSLRLGLAVFAGAPFDSALFEAHPFAELRQSPSALRRPHRPGTKSTLMR